MAAAFHSICQDLEQTIASAELSMYKWPTRQLYIIFRMADFHYNCCLFQVMDDNVAMAAELDVQQQRMDGLVSEMEGKSKAAVEQQKAALHAVNAKHESEVREEAPVSITFGQQVPNRLRIIYLESSRRELSIDICMGPIRGVGGSSNFFLGHFYGISNRSAESSAQAQSIGTLFEQIGLRGGSVDMSKSQRHTRSGAGRGVSQANETAINPKLTGLCQHEIVEF